MALEFAHGSVQWLTSQAVNTTITVSGLGFEPKAIRFYWVGIQSNSPTNATSGALNRRSGVGFAVSTTSRRSIGIFEQDGAGTSNCGSVAANNCVVITTDGNGAVDGRLDISSIGVDGFTLIVDDVTPQNLTVNYEAWGGTDITVAEIGDIAEPAATGTQNYTVTGFASDGVDQVLMFAGCQATTALNTAQATDAGLCVGFATSTAAANEVTLVGNSDDASGTADTDGYSFEGEVLSMIAIGGSATVSARANLSAWGTNQFTLNWTTRTTSNRRYVFLAIKGGKWRAGSYTIDSTAASNTATISGLSFQPNGISAFSRDLANNTAGSATADSVICFGTASGTSSRRAMGVNSDNGVDPMAINQIIRYDSYLAAPNFAGGIRALYDINALNTDGWEIIVDTANGAVSNVRQYYLTFGNEPVTPTPTPTITPTLTPTITPTQSAGGITFIGSTESTGTSITLPSGLQEGDIVIIVSGSDGTAQNLPTGYTNGQNGGSGVQYRWSYKFMGVTPDTDATGLSSTSVHMSFAFRGVDISNPLDVTPPTVTTDGGSATGMPDSPSITTVTDGCVVIPIGYLDDDVVAASVTAPAGYTLIRASQYGSGGAGATIMAAYLLQTTAGAENPAAFGGTGSDAWVGASVALRPTGGVAPSPTPTPTRTLTPTLTPTRTLTPTPTPSTAGPIPGGIVTSGLVLYLDPGNTSSYPGTGTVWTDLSTQGNNGTLVNSPTYFPYAYSGTFYFDGATQYVDLGTPASLNTGLQTYQLWVRAKTPDDGLNNQLWSRTNTNAGTFNVLKRNTGFWGSNLRLAASPASQTNQDSSQIARTNWRNIALSYDGTDLKFYWDGVEDASTNVPGLIDTASFTGMNLMRNTTGAAYFQGLLGVVLCYNRALTPAEIVQNYDAFYDRYLQRPQFQTIGHPFII